MYTQTETTPRFRGPCCSTCLPQVQFLEGFWRLSSSHPYENLELPSLPVHLYLESGLVRRNLRFDFLLNFCTRMKASYPYNSYQVPSYLSPLPSREFSHLYDSCRKVGLQNFPKNEAAPSLTLNFKEISSPWKRQYWKKNTVYYKDLESQHYGKYFKKLISEQKFGSELSTNTAEERLF